MFSISSPTLRSTITDYQVEFPRYQRNKAWNAEDKFKLFISVFKSYPIGSIVVKELIEGEKLWILDGRQRYEAIRDMQNPETVFTWARIFCGFSEGDDIKAILKEQISLYLGYDIDESTESWFTDLSEVICTVGRIKKKRGISAKTSGFRDPFIYKKYRPKYIVNLGDCYDVDPDKLLDWILGSRFIKTTDIDKLTAEEILKEYDVNESEREQVLEEINHNLYSIKKAVKIVKIIQTSMQKNQLSLITLDKACKSSDEMKIFEIVNTGGKKLNNAQIRSAKKQWNYEVKAEDIVDGDLIQDYRTKLYKAQELTLNPTCVSWDFAATFVDRLNVNSDILLSKKYRTMQYNEEQSKDKMEFGFKLLSARFKKSVTKESIDDLPENGFAWSKNCTAFASEINDLSDYLIKHDSIFEHFSNYGFSLFDIGQNVAICFLILAIERWDFYGRPTSGQKYRSFIQDIRSMLDSFIFDYVSDRWKGSGDSLLKAKLEAGYQSNIVKKEDWDSLINELYEDNEMQVGKWTEAKLGILTYYFTAVRNMEIHGNGEKVHIDHIIPKSQFMENTPVEFKRFRDSLVNYALLPPKLNKEKSDWAIQLSMPDKEAICKYEDLDIDKLDDIKAATGIPELKKMRESIPSDIKEKRDSYVSCSGYWVVN